MGYPNVPLGTTEWQRKLAQATNYLINRVQFNHWVIEGEPASGEVFFETIFPVPLNIIASSCAGWAPAATVATNDAAVSFYLNDTLIGTITYPAGVQDAVVAFTTTAIPSHTPFKIVLPTPQDATLADFTLILATSST